MISNKLVKEFGGTFDVISTPNEGSKFTFTIQLNELEIDNDEFGSNNFS